MNNKKNKNNINFELLAKEHGFLKARELLKQATIDAQQQRIESAEEEVKATQKIIRVKELVKTGVTYGNANSEAVLDKLLNTSSLVHISRLSSEKTGSDKRNNDNACENGKPTKTSESSFLNSPLYQKLMNESGLRSNSVSKADVLSARVSAAKGHTTTKDYVREAIRSDSKHLLVANKNLDYLPSQLGDTFHLQISYLNKILCSTNNISTITSYKMPQLSLYHLRYLKEINLSSNKLVSLPSDIGILESLEQMNLSYNMLSKLPPSIGKLKHLMALILKGNNLSILPHEFIYLDRLEQLDLSENIFTLIPYGITKLKSIKSINFSKNSMTKLAILPPMMKKVDMWMKVIDRRTGKEVYMNILTKERVREIEFYDGSGIKRAFDLHVFQKPNTLSYRRRKLWLNSNNIHEWESVVDPNTGLEYYRNNISGETDWDMPPSLDNIGLMLLLEEINMAGNSIKTIPSSFLQLVHMKKIFLARNRIRELPHNIGELVHLEILDLTSNELQLLPLSICDCKGLKELLLKDNHLLRLPEPIGYLPELRKLDVTMNHLKQLPSSLGYSKLEFFFAYENPLVDPPADEITKGLESVRWYLRNKYLIEQRGMPPEMEYHSIGINKEVTVLKPEFDMIIKQMISTLSNDGFLNLQLLNLIEIPYQVAKLKGLKKLRLDYNEEITFPKGFDKELKGLTYLSLRLCKLCELPDNLAHLKQLSTLLLEGNEFEMLPSKIMYLISLTTLDVSKNNLFSLPDGLHKLTNLKTLNLESNNIEQIPIELGQLKQLKVLNLAHNRINDFPESLCYLSAMKILNIEKNKLKFLPKKISNLFLIELRIGYNMIEYLPDDIFSYNLKSTLMFFSVCENNLLELPLSIAYLHIEAKVDADYNPLLSPPPYLLSEKLVVLQNYLLIRYHRKKSVIQLLEDDDFDVNHLHLSPIAQEVFLDGTGFLTPSDLLEFDTSLNEFLNGEYYKCPVTTKELVDRIILLREKREIDMYLLIINTFLKILTQLNKQKNKKYKSHLTFDTRPWGRDGEDCNVW
eukprot:gene10659-14314_t